MDPLVQEAHLAELEQHGVTAIRNAIAPALLEALRSAHDEVCERIRRNTPRSEWSFESDEPGVVDFFRAFELHPCFEELIDLPTVFPVLAAALRGGRGRDPGEPRCGGPVCQYLPAGTGSEMAWHRDGDLIRLTYLLEDCPSDAGGTTYIPGSHTSASDHLEQELNDADGAPRWPEAAQVMSGRAGDCFVNWTMIWHTRSPSAAAAPDRKLFWLVYRRDSQPPDRQYGRAQDSLSHGYLARRRREWAGREDTRLALWSDITEENYGFDLLDEDAQRKELSRLGDGGGPLPSRL
jgi:hypothetical protein